MCNKMKVAQTGVPTFVSCDWGTTRFRLAWVRNGRQVEALARRGQAVLLQRLLEAQ